MYYTDRHLFQTSTQASFHDGFELVFHFLNVVIFSLVGSLLTESNYTV